MRAAPFDVLLSQIWNDISGGPMYESRKEMDALRTGEHAVPQYRDGTWRDVFGDEHQARTGTRFTPLQSEHFKHEVRCGVCGVCVGATLSRRALCRLCTISRPAGRASRASGVLV